MKRFIWTTYIDSLDKKYSMFYINRKFKDSSFKNEDEYLGIQKKLAEEIEILNKEILDAIKITINEVYPDIKVLVYDSRTFSRSNSFIGNILVSGLKTESETLDVKACFEKFTSLKISVGRYEDLTEENKKIIDNVMGN